VAGCNEGECHYKRGTYLGRSKVALLEAILSQMGVQPGRVRFVELGALDRAALPGIIGEMSAELKHSTVTVA